MVCDLLSSSLSGYRRITCAPISARAGTCDPETKRLRADHSSNGLHLNGVGYRRIAETIFDEVTKSVLIRELDMD